MGLMIEYLKYRMGPIYTYLNIARGRAASWTLITGAAHSLLQTRAGNMGETGLNYQGNIADLWEAA